MIKMESPRPLESFECVMCYLECNRTTAIERLLNNVSSTSEILDNALSLVKKCANWPRRKEEFLLSFLDSDLTRMSTLLQKSTIKGKIEGNVRRRLMENMLNIYGIPSVFIDIEVPIKAGTTIVYADIVVYKDTERRYPLFVIEVKDPAKVNIDKASLQAKSYATLLGIGLYYVATEYIHTFSMNETRLYYMSNKKWVLESNNYLSQEPLSWTQHDVSEVYKIRKAKNGIHTEKKKNPEKNKAMEAQKW